MTRVFHQLVLAASFLAAFLSFSIQPMAGKAILPLIGGTPQGWLVTLAFFQTTLTAGYALVYLTRALPPRLVVAGVALGLAGAAWLFNTQMPGVPATGGWPLFVFLWQWLGLPLVCLGTMAPLVQRLFFASIDASPYGLYAVSNVGSLLGLLAYPFAIEPLTGLHAQGETWRIGVGALAAVALLAAAFARPRAATDAPADEPETLNARRIGLWVLLAMAPASLLSGSTLLVTTDAGSFPLLWVVPLALYLGTYILAFRGGGFTVSSRMLNGFSVAVVILTVLSMWGSAIRDLLTPWGYAAALFTAFAFTALLCHSRLYSLRPHARHLPLFYLTIAAGGAMGGAFNAFIAPVIFDTVIEYYLMLLAALALVVPVDTLTPQMRRLAFYAGGTAVATLVIARVMPPIVFVPCMLLVTLALFVSFLNVRVFAVATAFCLLFVMSPGGADVHVRNFFGVLRVMDTPSGDARVLIHGVTLHGTQPKDAAWHDLPATYYTAEGPLGDIMTLAQRGRVAAVGLGIGQIACYATPERRIDYYEIDPDVVQLAKTHFDYLAKCPAEDIVLGDARLSLAQSERTYSLIILDAFTSDAVPAHLLTREAVETYRARLAPGGILLFHISNRYLSLERPLAATAAEAGLWAQWKIGRDKPENPYDSPSIWLAMGSDAAVESRLRDMAWEAPTPGTGWTDDYAPVLRAMRFTPSASGKTEN